MLVADDQEEHAMAQKLDGCRVAIVATDGVEQIELTEPLKALRNEIGRASCRERV